MSNTDFSREHVEKWFATFKKKCPDCLLDKAGFIEFYKNLIPGNSEVKDEFAEAVFQAFDSDNNGFVDFGKILLKNFNTKIYFYNFFFYNLKVNFLLRSGLRLEEV